MLIFQVHWGNSCADMPSFVASFSESSTMQYEMLISISLKITSPLKACLFQTHSPISQQQYNDHQTSAPYILKTVFGIARGNKTGTTQTSSSGRGRETAGWSSSHRHDGKRRRNDWTRWSGHDDPYTGEIIKPTWMPLYNAGIQVGWDCVGSC